VRPQRFDHLQFTDEQWRKIITPLGQTDIPIRYRQRLLAFAALLHHFHRQPELSFVQERDQIELIADLSAGLRDAIEGTRGHVPGIAYLAFGGERDFDRARTQWRDFVARLSDVANAAIRMRTDFARRRATASNVDVPRDYVWAQLDELYRLITGHRPKFKVATANTIGKKEREVYGDFVEFVQAFASAVPGEKKPSGNAIRECIRKLRRGERSPNFAEH